MSRIIEELVNNPSLLEHYKKKPEYKTDIKKIIVPTSSEEEKEIMRRERSWFTEAK